MESTSPALARRLWDDAKARPARLGPGRIARPLRALAIVTWNGAAIMLAFGFIPGIFTRIDGSLYEGQLQYSFAPLWPLLCGVAIGSGAAAVGYVITSTGPHPLRHHIALAWAAGVMTPAIPLLLLVSDRRSTAIPVGVAWLAATALVVYFVHVRRRPLGPWTGLLLAVLVAAPWLPAIYDNLRLALALGAETPPSADTQLEMLLTTIPVQTYVPGVALVFVGAMATGGVALAAHSRSEMAHRISRHRRGWRGTAVICVIAILVIVVAVTNIGGLASGFEENYWRLGGPWTWVHAVIVAGATAWLTQRSFQTPLIQRGDVATTLAVGVSALSAQIVIGIATIANLVALTIHGPTGQIVSIPAELGLLVAVAGVAALVPIAFGSRWRGTIGRAVARVGLLYLVPIYIGVLPQQAGFTFPVSFWAKASQVAICLTVIGCAATILGLLGRKTPLSPEAAARLVLIPLLIVSGTAWLPTVIAAPMTPVIAVTAALFALLWTLPSDSDDTGHSGVVLTISAQLLLVAAAAGIVTVLPDLSGDDPMFAMLLFSVPLSMLLCANVKPADETTDDEAALG